MRFIHALIGVSLSALLLGEVQATSPDGDKEKSLKRSHSSSQSEDDKKSTKKSENVMDASDTEDEDSGDDSQADTSTVTPIETEEAAAKRKGHSSQRSPRRSHSLPIELVSQRALSQVDERTKYIKSLVKEQHKSSVLPVAFLNVYPDVLPMIIKMDDVERQRLQGPVAKVREARSQLAAQKLKNEKVFSEAKMLKQLGIQSSEDLTKEIEKREAELTQFREIIVTYYKPRKHQATYYTAHETTKESTRLAAIRKLINEIEESEDELEDASAPLSTVQKEIEQGEFERRTLQRARRKQQRLEKKVKQLEEALQKDRPNLEILNISERTRDSNITTLRAYLSSADESLSPHQKLLKKNQFELQGLLAQSFAALKGLNAENKNIQLSELVHPVIVDSFAKWKINLTGGSLEEVLNYYIAPSCPLLSCLTFDEVILMRPSIEVGDWNQRITAGFLKDRQEKLSTLVLDLHNALRAADLKIAEGQPFVAGKAYKGHHEAINEEFKNIFAQERVSAYVEFIKLLKAPYTFMPLEEKEQRILAGFLGQMDPLMLTLLSLRVHPELLNFAVDSKYDRVQNEIWKLASASNSETPTTTGQRTWISQAILRVWGVYVQTELLKELQKQLASGKY